MNKLFLALASAFLLGALNLSAAVTAEEYAKLRKAAREERQRKVIFNNDGCDIMYFPKDWPATKENFLKLRTSILKGYCDTLTYCPVSAGMGHFTLQLPGADFLTANPPVKNARNIARELADAGQDYFQWLIDFCRENKMEIFFCLRVNDTHDVRHTPQKPNIFFAPWKEKNRHLLFAPDPARSTKNAAWSAVDFTHKEVRDRQLALIRAVLEKYDVDGIDLDFSRYLPIFRTTGLGVPVKPEEIEMMNDLMRKTRKLLDEYGMKRGKAILLSVVLPDSQKRCYRLGYDIETWFKEGLIDIWQQEDCGPSAPVAEAVALAHKYNVKYYAFNGKPYPFGANEKATYLTRNVDAANIAMAHTAIHSGADGVYLYNYANEGAVKVASQTNTAVLDKLPRRYFMTSFNWAIPRGYAYSPEDYDLFRNLNAFIHWQIAPGDEINHYLEMGTAPQKNDRIIAHIDRWDGTPGAIKIESNSVQWKPVAIDGRYEIFEVPAAALKKGVNKVRVYNDAASGKEIVNFQPKKLGDFELRFFGGAAIKAFNMDKDGSFTVDNSKGFAALVKRLGNNEYTQLNISCKVKITDGKGFIRISNCGYLKVINFTPDRIAAAPDLDKAGKFSDYRDVHITVKGKNLTCKIDGVEVYKTDTMESSFAPEVNKMFPDASRLFSAAPAVMFGHHGNGQAGAEIHFKDLKVSNPAGTAEILNIMLEIDPAIDIKKELALQDISKVVKSTPRGVQGKISQPGSVMASEIVIEPNHKPVYWFISDGKQVAAWTLDNQIVRKYPNYLARIDSNRTGKPVTYTMVMGHGEPALYRNGCIFYQTNDLGFITWRNYAFSCSKEVYTVNKFLAEHGKKFSDAQLDILRNGGCIAQSSGQIKSVKLFEKNQK